LNFYRYIHLRKGDLLLQLPRIKNKSINIYAKFIFKFFVFSSLLTSVLLEAKRQKRIFIYSLILIISSSCIENNKKKIDSDLTIELEKINDTLSKATITKITNNEKNVRIIEGKPGYVRAEIERIKKSNKNLAGLQVGFIAMNIEGEHGAHSVYSGFEYAHENKTNSNLIKSSYDFEWK